MKGLSEQYHHLIYVALFVLLGLQMQYMVHGAAEIVYLNYLLDDVSRYGLGLSWSDWMMIDRFASWGFLVVGAVIGFIEGRHWWGRLYGQGPRNPPQRPSWLR